MYTLIYVKKNGETKCVPYIKGISKVSNLPGLLRCNMDEDSSRIFFVPLTSVEFIDYEKDAIVKTDE
jgi:hypothetical protein